MADKENQRKCFKCKRSPIEDGVKLFRFPNPSKLNLVRCELWAQFMYPDKQDITIEMQKKMHNEHKMLCQNHFKDEDFTDGSKSKLLRSAVPSNKKLVIPIAPLDPQPGPSQRPSLSNITNINITDNSLTNVDNKVENNLNFIKCTKYMKKIHRLKHEIKNLKSKQTLEVLSENRAIKKLSEKITPAFALLLQGQIRNFKRKSWGRRWSNEEKIIALRIYKRSPTCYRLLRRLFPLPSPSILKCLLNKIPLRVGINQPVFKVLKKFVKKQKSSDNEYVLMFDEMSLKKHLMYNPKSDHIEGYQDHGSQGRSALVAGYALVFMIAGIRQKVKQPVAHYFSSAFSTADRLAILIKEVLQQCFKAGINIACVVCDMDRVNCRALKIMGASVDKPYINVNGKEIVTFFDTPHLLKCFRNLFMKYDLECNVNISSDDKAGKGIAKWSHIIEFFEKDNMNPNFVFAPGLKKEHLFPNAKQKMKVNLAAQVLSHSVAAGIYAKVSDGTLTAEAAVTANVISKIDKLFDTLNSDTSDLRRGKPHATNLSDTSPHIKLFHEMRTFFRTLKYIGCPRRPPSQDGWIWTLNGVERLWKNLKSRYNVKSLSTRRLQQDPLENLFGCIRGNCGSNTNPTCGQFVAGLKTSILSNLSHMGTTGNCELDNNIVINNFNSLLSYSPPHTTQADSVVRSSDKDLTLLQTQIESDFNDNTSEIQACAYVCGYILKRIPLDCDLCKNIFVSSAVREYHLFVECREYDDITKSLNYATKDMIKYVEYCATIINTYLSEYSYTDVLKEQVTEIISTSVNFDFIKQCSTHCEQNIRILINSIFTICIKRFCTLKNRSLAEEASASALQRKLNILMHK